MQTSIRCMLMRGGTSRGAYFQAEDLPTDAVQRDHILRQVMGGPDALQVDGLGGGHPLSSKVAIVRSSSREDADVEYLFLQVSPTEQTVAATQNCGNILAGVGPFAIETGLVKAQPVETVVRVHMLNSNSRCELTVQTPGGAVCFDGDTRVDGVPGTSAPIVCDFLDVAGSSCGALLPTGHAHDEIDGVAVTCIDNGMPVVVIRADDLGIDGYASPQQLDLDCGLKRRLESIRLQAGRMMHLGDVAQATVPKICIISPPIHGGHVATRTFIPHVCHRAIGVLGAITVATACILPATVAAEMVEVPSAAEKLIQVEHPSGATPVRLSVVNNHIRRAGVVRTARLIMKGEVYVSLSDAIG